LRACRACGARHALQRSAIGFNTVPPRFRDTPEVRSAPLTGADVVVDYHDPEWTGLARGAAGSSGIRAAANAAGGGEADALSTLVDAGRLATITGAPPPEERGISITNVIVRPDGDQLRLLAASLAEGKLHIDIGASYPLKGAAEALAQAIKGSGSAIVLEL
jgi:NADPH:quinone reductase-like Zn-dependent oxidoreductase